MMDGHRMAGSIRVYLSVIILVVVVLGCSSCNRGRAPGGVALEPPAGVTAVAAAGEAQADEPDGWAEHRTALEKRTPPGFTIVEQPPFFVVGDETPEAVEIRAEQTVKWAVDRLKKDFFEKDPDDIIDIWLFRDDASYMKHAESLFGHTPSTPYGYYCDENKVLVMNISTGGGTLVHEIVHPFVASNFPECPAWFNEGLGSLFEQCTDRDGHIWGLTNWRLAGLQEAVSDDSVPSFETLTGTTDHEFYDLDPGTNYAQARYLCLYLQEKGLLVDFWNAFREDHEKDPTGYETLKKVLGVEDMVAFQDTWETWVMTLTFP